MKQQMTGTIWFRWKITHLVTTRHAHPLPQCLTLSHVTVVQERLQLEKVKRWPGPRTKWSQLSKTTCSKEEMVLPPNSQLRVITMIQPWRMASSILLWGSLFHVLWWRWRWWGGGFVKQRLGLCETDTWSLVRTLSFFPFMSHTNWAHGWLFFFTCLPWPLLQT